MKWLFVASCVLTFSVINAQIPAFCQFFEQEAGYLCNLNSVNYDVQGEVFTIFGNHVSGFSDVNVTRVSLLTTTFPSRMVTIPAALLARFQNIRELHLHGGSIQYISGLQTNCALLEVLSLSQNIIAGITEEAFINCPNLRHINLASNVILAINEGAFRGLNQLHTLELNNNALQSLSPATFSLLPSIRDITLQHNHLTEIPTGLFSQLPTLQNVALHNNRITRIYTNAFQALPSVWNIDLSSNEIADIDPQGFSALTSMETLYLNNNSLTRLNTNSFVNLPALTDLRIDVNQITAVQRGFFANFPNVRSVNALGNLCVDRSFQIPPDQDLLQAFETCFVNWVEGPDPTPPTTIEIDLPTTPGEGDTTPVVTTPIPTPVPTTPGPTPPPTTVPPTEAPTTTDGSSTLTVSIAVASMILVSMWML